MDYALHKVRRSRLIMPVHQRKYVEKAYTRNADAVCLDLEDSVPEQEKLAARAMVREGIALAGKGGSEVIVRINNTRELIMGDLEASVWPGLGAVLLPKCESAEDIRELERHLARLEGERGMTPGSVTINTAIESPRGYLNAEAVFSASGRVDSMTLGTEDFTASIDLVTCPETQAAMLSVRIHLLIAARARNLIPMGLVGSMTNFKDTDEFEKLAALSFKHGFLGSSCIHPGNVEILNRCFTFSSETVAYAEEVIAALDVAYAEGLAAVALHGKMIDIAHYAQAKKVLERHAAIEAHEARKHKARASIGG